MTRFGVGRAYRLHSDLISSASYSYSPSSLHTLRHVEKREVRGRFLFRGAAKDDDLLDGEGLMLTCFMKTVFSFS